jgi:hypothetical protein
LPCPSHMQPRQLVWNAGWHCSYSGYFIDISQITNTVISYKDHIVLHGEFVITPMLPMNQNWNKPELQPETNYRLLSTRVKHTQKISI